MVTTAPPLGGPGSAGKSIETGCDGVSLDCGHSAQWLLTVSSSHCCRGSCAALRRPWRAVAGAGVEGESASDLQAPKGLPQRRLRGWV